jgi:uncharacterized membrane protein YeaQ/YmgE (transglycosylase-associated protein family)
MAAGAILAALVLMEAASADRRKQRGPQDPCRATIARIRRFGRVGIASPSANSRRGSAIPVVFDAVVIVELPLSLPVGPVPIGITIESGSATDLILSNARPVALHVSVVRQRTPRDDVRVPADTKKATDFDKAGYLSPSRSIIQEERVMENAGIGWIAAIIIGGFAGWLAEKFMKSDMGIFMNIILGMIGAAIASAILSWFGVILGGWIGYLIAGFIGACILIWIVRALKGRSA